MAKSPVKRVTVSEQAARAFFLWGYHKAPGEDLPTTYPFRVNWAHRWPNLWHKTTEQCPHCHKWFSKGSDVADKLIDITGCTWVGESFICEAKEWDTTSHSNQRFLFSRVSDKQIAFLTSHTGMSFLWLGAVVPSKDRRLVNRRMFLIPWPEWLLMQDQYIRYFKNGKCAAWKSISLVGLEYYFAQYELVEHAYHKNERLVRAWFTQKEMDLPREYWDNHPYPPTRDLSYESDGQVLGVPKEAE